MKHTKRIVSILAAFALGLSSLSYCPAYAEPASAGVKAQDGAQRLEIASAADLAAFAKACSLDSYSDGLYVTLSADIELSGAFEPVPIFRGTFDGSGHTVSGLSISKDGSYIGLFRFLERGAVVKDLTVKGTVEPKGSAKYVGGIAGSNAGNIVNCTFAGKIKGEDNVGCIAGINEKTGLISDCEATGAATGSHETGGIAGTSSGTILNSTSHCSVNTTASEAKLSIEDIDWDNIISSEEPASMTDAGGIAGYSDGIIQGCENFGTVGYPHIGYNVGGIVGRQSGFVNSCVNHAEIFGRKDVGGIAGQMEPYRSIDFDKDTVQKLLDELDVLGGLVDKLTDDAENAGHAVDDKVQGLTWQMDKLRQSADDIADRTENIYNGWADGINEVSARADEALDGLAPALDGFSEALDLMSEFSSALEAAFDSVSAANDDMQNAIDEGKAGLDILNGALDDISSALNDISAAVSDLRKSLGDTDKVQAALTSIISSLKDVNGSVKDVTAALTKIGKACDELEQWLTGSDFKQLGDALSSLGSSMQDVTKALSKMSSALEKIAGSVDAEKMQEGFDELSSAAGDLSKAAVHIAIAIGEASSTTPDTDKIKDELSSAADNVASAADHLSAAADKINDAIDSKQLNEGLSELEKAAGELADALDKAQKAIKDANDAFDKIKDSDVPEDAYDEISKQMKRINSALSSISDSMDDVNDALAEINEQVDLGALGDSLDAISSAASKLSKASDAISSSQKNFDAAADSLSAALDTLAGASEAASDASGYLSDACAAFSDAVDILSDTVHSLADKPVIEFPAADDEYSAAVDGFSNDFAGITNALSSISSTASAQGDVLLDDMREINAELQNISDILQELKDKAMNNDEGGDGVATDVSEDGSTSRQGKALACTNYGGVQGDVNVGGITGSMAIDFDFDPEDDIARNGDTSLSFSYKIRDVIESSANYGEITVKKNYGGGIVGKMDMGAVNACTESGKVTSTAGSYAGGIAGYSTAAIRKCVSRAAISASSYVGGIAGQGLILTDNAALLDVSDCTERAGAIAGYVDFSDDGTEISGNVFVDRGTAGVDGISYAKKAYPVDYEAFAQLAGSAAVISVTFTVDGEELSTVRVEYGGALSESDFPAIPEKEGCFAQWSEFDSSCITYPVVAEAVYTPYVTSIESAQKSEDGFALVLADGVFGDGSTISVETQSSSVFAPDENSELRLVTISCDIPQGSTSRLRFLAPHGKGTTDVMQYVNGAWKSVKFTENGSYLIVEAPSLENGSGSFCVCRRPFEYLTAIIIGGCALVAVINIVLWTILIKKKHSARKAAKQAEKPEEAAQNAEKDSEESKNTVNE